MIEIPNSAKSEYKEDSVVKSMLVTFRDLGTMLTDKDIVQESESITESICSSGSFKVGLCEASQGAISVNLAPNVENDEMTIIQTLGYFEPTVTVDNTKGVTLSGDGVTIGAEQEIGEVPEDNPTGETGGESNTQGGNDSGEENTGEGGLDDEPTIPDDPSPGTSTNPSGQIIGDDETLLVQVNGSQRTSYWYPDSVDLAATYTDGDLSVIETQHLGSEDSDVTTTLDATKHVYVTRVSGTADYAVQNENRLVGQQNFSLDNSGTGDFAGNVPRFDKIPSSMDITGYYKLNGADISETHRVLYNESAGKISYTFPLSGTVYPKRVAITARFTDGELTADKGYSFGNNRGSASATLDANVAVWPTRVQITTTKDVGPEPCYGDCFEYVVCPDECHSYGGCGSQCGAYTCGSEYCYGYGACEADFSNVSPLGASNSTETHYYDYQNLSGNFSHNFGDIDSWTAIVTWSNGQVTYPYGYGGAVSIPQRSLPIKSSGTWWGTVYWSNYGENTEISSSSVSGNGRSVTINAGTKTFDHYWATVYWSDGDYRWNPHNWGGNTFECGPVNVPLTHYKGKILWSNGHESDIEVGDGYNYQSYAISIEDKDLPLSGWSATTHWTDDTISTETGSTTSVAINKRAYTEFVSSYFEADKYYLMLAKIKYTGKYVYLYVLDNREKPRMVYFLDKDLTLIPDGQAFTWIQVAIPFVGLDFKDYGCAVYGKYDPEADYDRLEGYATMYIIDRPIMPLGLFGITSCRKRNDSNIRDLQGYDRMKDTNLSDDIHFLFNSDQWSGFSGNVPIGEVLNYAALGTQIQIGSNLSKDPVKLQEVQDSRTTIELGAAQGFPTGTIYAADKVNQETASGTVDKTNPSGRFAYTEWTTRQAYDEVQTIRTNGFLSGVPSSWYDSAGFRADYYLTGEYGDTCYRTEYYYAGSIVVEDPEASYVICTKTVRIIPTTPTGYTLYNISGLTYTYYKNTRYDFKFNSKYSSDGWYVAQETLNGCSAYSTQPVEATSTGTCTRVYRQVISQKSWTVVCMGTTVTYKIPNYDHTDTDIKYSIFTYSPEEYGAYVAEDVNVRQAFVEPYLAEGAVIRTDQQATLRRAIYSWSTHDPIVVESSDPTAASYGTFTVKYVSQILYGGSDIGSIACGNLLRGVSTSSNKEKFDDTALTVLNQEIHTTRRSVISSYLELNGLFIRFDRYGVSNLFSVRMNALYPAEDLYPQASGLYPMEGSSDVAAASLCKEIYVSDKINKQFDGVKISGNGQWYYPGKSYCEANNLPYLPGTVAEGWKSFPFYFNRLNRTYGQTPSGMSEIDLKAWPKNYYYELSDNFFFNNFKFTLEQLLEICRVMMENIGSLQYFNMTATLRALPYLEAGDSISVLTARGGYDTAILRRTMKGCSAMMDTIETEFYK